MRPSKPTTVFSMSMWRGSQSIAFLLLLAPAITSRRPKFVCISTTPRPTSNSSKPRLRDFSNPVLRRIGHARRMAICGSRSRLDRRGLSYRTFLPTFCHQAKWLQARQFVCPVPAALLRIGRAVPSKARKQPVKSENPPKALFVTELPDQSYDLISIPEFFETLRAFWADAASLHWGAMPSFPFPTP